MPKLRDNAVPSYRLHKQSGNAIITLNGKDIILGPHGTPASKAEYRRRIAEWMAAGKQIVASDPLLTIAELIDQYRGHVECFYRHLDGSPTSEVKNIRQALRPLRKLYGTTPAAQFGPLKLKSVMVAMIDPKAAGLPADWKPWCRSSINKNAGRIKSMFRWAVEHEKLVGSNGTTDTGANVYHALLAVRGLQAGRSDACETEPVKPVPDAYIDATLNHVSPTIAAMIQLQLLTGMRPGELVTMQTANIDTNGSIWVYRPAQHKTLHHGIAREIRIGPKAQAILKPLLKLDLQAFIFSPKDAEARRRQTLHEERTTPLSCGNVPGSNVKRNPRRCPGDAYCVNAYRKAIERGCDAAFPPPDDLLLPGKETELAAWRRQHHWHPHQLRHTAATRLRREHGIDVARIILGHRHLRVTEVYAEADGVKADMVMQQSG